MRLESQSFEGLVTGSPSEAGNLSQEARHRRSISSATERQEGFAGRSEHAARLIAAFLSHRSDLQASAVRACSGEAIPISPTTTNATTRSCVLIAALACRCRAGIVTSSIRPVTKKRHSMAPLFQKSTCTIAFHSWWNKGGGHLGRHRTLDEDQSSLQRGGTHLQRFGVFRRGVPFAQAHHRGKLDDDERLRRRAAFHYFGRAAADEIPPAVLRDRGGRERAVALHRCRIPRLDFGNDIGAHARPLAFRQQKAAPEAPLFQKSI